MWNEENVVLAIENNLYNLWIMAAQVSENIVVKTNEMSWVSATNSDWPNGIFKVKSTKDEAEEFVVRVIKQMEVGTMPRYWTIGPQSTPENLSEYLMKKGFVNYYNQIGMAIDLNSISSYLPQSADFAVKKISDLELLKRWSVTSDYNFKESIDVSIREKLLWEEDVEFYGGFVKDKLVGTLMLFYACGVVGINFVSILPGYRRKGIGTGITLAALHSACKRGYKVGVLQASPMGLAVYKNLGFKGYFKLEHYRYDGASTGKQ